MKRFGVAIHVAWFDPFVAVPEGKHQRQVRGALYAALILFFPPLLATKEHSFHRSGEWLLYRTASCSACLILSVRLAPALQLACLWRDIAYRVSNALRSTCPAAHLLVVVKQSGAGWRSWICRLVAASERCSEVTSGTNLQIQVILLFRCILICVSCIEPDPSLLCSGSC